MTPGKGLESLNHHHLSISKNDPAMCAVSLSWGRCLRGQHLRPYPEAAAQESEKRRWQLWHGCSRRHLGRELGSQSIVSPIFDHLDLSDLAKFQRSCASFNACFTYHVSLVKLTLLHSFNQTVDKVLEGDLTLAYLEKYLKISRNNKYVFTEEGHFKRLLV